MKDDRAEWRQSVEALTARLRTEQGTGWASLRETLSSQGIDPAQAFLAIIYPDDVATLVAVVVASADQMLRMDVDYPRGIEDYAEAMNRGHVVSWENDVAMIRSEERLSSTRRWSCSRPSRRASDADPAVEPPCTFPSGDRPHASRLASGATSPRTVSSLWTYRSRFPTG